MQKPFNPGKLSDSLVIWFSGGIVSVRSDIGLGDLGGLFQPKWFCDSVKTGMRDKEKHGYITDCHNVFPVSD